jgi:hypothetical protein
MPASPTTNATQHHAARGTTTIVSRPADLPPTADTHPAARPLTFNHSESNEPGISSQL